MPTLDARFVAETAPDTFEPVLLDGDRALTVSDAEARATVATLLTGATFTARDLASEAGQAAAVALLTAIGVDTTKLDVPLSTLLTSATFTARDLATDAAAQAAVALLTSLDGKDFASEVTLAAVLASLAAGVTVTNPDFPLPDAQVVTLTPRVLASTTDSVRAVDAAEDSGLVAVPFTITSTGTTVLVAAPGGGGLLRLRRLSPTYAIRSPDSEPVLALFVGSVEVQRGNALTGRFDVTAGADSDAITLDVDVLDPSGVVAGTVYYELA